MKPHNHDNPTNLVDECQDDPEARNLLRQAFDNTARWQEPFPGFWAHVKVHMNGKNLDGIVEIKHARDVKVSLPDEHVKQWVQNQLAMIAAHRVPRNFDDSDGKYVLTVEPEDAHPLGPKLLIHGDGFNSFYRIKEGRLTQINRTMSGGAFTINVEESFRTLEGRYLTTKYSVYFRSPDGKELKNVESITDSHVRIGSSDLPASRRIISFEDGNVLVNTLCLEGHQLFDQTSDSLSEPDGPVKEKVA